LTSGLEPLTRHAFLHALALRESARLWPRDKTCSYRTALPFVARIRANVGPEAASEMAAVLYIGRSFMVTFLLMCR
jgi:hypothetical protein